MKRNKKSQKIGLAPGVLVFTGHQKIDEVKIQYCGFNEEILNEAIFNGTEAFTLQNTDSLVDWYDIRGIHDTDIIAQIGAAIDIHPLVLEDIVDINQRSKFEEFDTGLLLILKAIEFDSVSKVTQYEHISIYFNEGALLSFQEDESDVFEAAKIRLRKNRGKIRSRRTDYLAFALADIIVDKYYIVLDHIQSEIELIEDLILAGETNDVKEQIHHYKKEIIKVRKSLVSIRETVAGFNRSDNELIAEGSKIFIRDLFSHTLHLVDGIDTQRDILNGLQDLYLSEISNKMNQIMKVLTIITTIFVPLSFLAGLYGMNFEYMPELKYHYGYPILIITMFIILLGSLFYFKKKKWL